MTRQAQLAAAGSETQDWIDDLVRRLDWQSREKTLDALIAAFHALRDGLPWDEAVQVGAFLPLILRGFYYEGWVGLMQDYYGTGSYSEGNQFVHFRMVVQVYIRQLCFSSGFHLGQGIYYRSDGGAGIFTTLSFGYFRAVRALFGVPKQGAY